MRTRPLSRRKRGVVTTLLDEAINRAAAKADLLDRFATETRIDTNTEVGLLALGAAARRLIQRWEAIDAKDGPLPAHTASNRYYDYEFDANDPYSKMSAGWLNSQQPREGGYVVRDIPFDRERFEAALNSETYPCPEQNCRGEITIEWEVDYDEIGGRSYRYPIGYTGRCCDPPDVYRQREGDDDDGDPIEWYYDRNHAARMTLESEGEIPNNAPLLVAAGEERRRLRRLYYQGW
jgi:hypothetical protein